MSDPDPVELRQALFEFVEVARAAQTGDPVISWQSVSDHPAARRLVRMIGFIHFFCPEPLLRSGLLEKLTLDDAAATRLAVDEIVAHAPGTERRWQHVLVLDGLGIKDATSMNLEALLAGTGWSLRLERLKADELRGSRFAAQRLPSEAIEYERARWVLLGDDPTLSIRSGTNVEYYVGDSGDTRLREPYLTTLAFLSMLTWVPFRVPIVALRDPGWEVIMRHSEGELRTETWSTQDEDPQPVELPLETSTIDASTIAAAVANWAQPIGSLLARSDSAGTLRGAMRHFLRASLSLGFLRDPTEGIDLTIDENVLSDALLWLVSALDLLWVPYQERSKKALLGAIMERLSCGTHDDVVGLYEKRNEIAHGQRASLDVHDILRLRELVVTGLLGFVFAFHARGGPHSAKDSRIETIKFVKASFTKHQRQQLARALRPTIGGRS